MQESVDLIPNVVIQSIPGLERVIKLSADMKNVAAEALALIDKEEQRQRQSFDYKFRESDIEINRFSISSMKKNDDVELDADIEFEDAKSHVSEDVQASFEDGKLLVPHRKSLPYLRNPDQRINIWKVIKDSIGKEFSKITVPVYFNEPLSFLQRFTEDLTHSDIIERACAVNDPQLRLALIACFAISQYSKTPNRTMKPFNPLLGETFEFETKGFRCISEQVSHHPPVSAICCEHPNYAY